MSGIVRSIRAIVQKRPQQRGEDGKKPAKKKGLFYYLRIVVSIILIAWLVQVASEANIVSILARANLFYILLAIVLVNVDRSLMAYKWHLLLTAKDIPVSLSSVIGTYYKATFWSGFFLPSLGGDALRIYEVSQQSKRWEDVTSSVVLERAIGIIATACVGILGIGLFIAYVDSGYVKTLWSFVALLAIILAVFALSMNPRWVRLFQKWFVKSKWKFTGKLAQILESYQDYAKHRRVLLVFLFWSILEQFMPILHYFVIVKALHFDMTFIHLVMFVPITTAIERLPISYNGFGVREGLFIYLFGLVGIPQGEAFLLGFISRIVGKFAYAAPFAVGYTFMGKIKLSAIKSRFQKRAVR